MVRKFCLAAGCSPQSDLLQCCPRYCLISFHPILPQHDYGWYLQIHKDAKSHKKYPNAGHPKAPTWHPWHPETPLCPKHLSTFLKNVFMSSWQWSGSPSLWSRETCDPMMIKIIKTDVSSTPKLRLPSVSLGINQSSRAAIRLNPQWIIIIIIIVIIIKDIIIIIVIVNITTCSMKASNKSSLDTRAADTFIKSSRISLFKRWRFHNYPKKWLF